MAEHLTLEGGCMCGRVRYRAVGETLGVVHCHCKTCQRNSGAAFLTGVGFRGDAVTWLREQPKLYASSENGRRGFCAECGSAISFHWMDKGIVFVLGGTLDDPGKVTPELHIWTRSEIPWARLDDGLPRYDADKDSEEPLNLT